MPLAISAEPMGLSYQRRFQSCARIGARGRPLARNIALAERIPVSAVALRQGLRQRPITETWLSETERKVWSPVTRSIGRPS